MTMHRIRIPASPMISPRVDVPRPLPHSIWRNHSAAAAIEFAIISPLFLLCLLSLIAYGIYLSAAHSIQQIAADAARTAIAGLSEPERERLATDYIQRTTMDHAFIQASRMTVTVSEDPNNANQFTVRIKYDAGDLPIFNLFTFAMPSPQIVRFATIRIGGV